MLKRLAAPSEPVVLALLGTVVFATLLPARGISLRSVRSVETILLQLLLPFVAGHFLRLQLIACAVIARHHAGQEAANP